MKNEYEQFTFRQKAVAAVCILAAVLAAAVGFVLTHYHITDVTVIGNHHYSEDEIRAMVLKDNILDNSLLLSMEYRDKSISSIPFIESMDVEILGADSIRIMVYEKSLAGCVKYLGNYLYFDREGIIVESAGEATEGVPEITGLTFGYVQLYEKLPVKDDDVFREIINMTQLLEKYEVGADKIYFDPDMEITLYFGSAKVRLGNDRQMDEKIMQLSVMIPAIEGKSGTLDMRDFGENTKMLTFEPE